MTRTKPIVSPGLAVQNGVGSTLAIMTMTIPGTHPSGRRSFVKTMWSQLLPNREIHCFLGRTLRTQVSRTLRKTTDVFLLMAMHTREQIPGYILVLAPGEKSPLAESDKVVFGYLDWSIVAAYIVGTTLVGHDMKGKQHSTRDFFLGGRSRSCYAVTASTIAATISAIIFIGVPALVYDIDGSFVYLQFTFG